MEHVLEVRDLVTVFNIDGKDASAVDHVSFHLDKGEIIGVVGESGSGKSVTMMSLLKLIAPPGRIVNGEVRIHPVCDTAQVKDYSEYEMAGIPGERKLARREERFPEKLALAYEIGKRQ